MGALHGEQDESGEGIGDEKKVHYSTNPPTSAVPTGEERVTCSFLGFKALLLNSELNCQAKS